MLWYESRARSSRRMRVPRREGGGLGTEVEVGVEEEEVVVTWC